MKFYGQFDIPVDKILYERYFINKKNGISLEAGAFDGVLENSTKFFEEFMNWKTINIEPLNHIYKNLVTNRPNSINLNYGLSNIESKTKIRVYDIEKYGIFNTNASICHTDAHMKNLEIMSGNKYLEQDINTITYKNLIKDLNLEKLDLFVLDVEGYEINVIEGMYNCDVLPDIFVIEHGHRKVGVFDEYLDKLNSKYILDYVYEVNSYYKKIN